MGLRGGREVIGLGWVERRLGWELPVVMLLGERALIDGVYGIDALAIGRRLSTD